MTLQEEIYVLMLEGTQPESGQESEDDFINRCLDAARATTLAADVFRQVVTRQALPCEGDDMPACKVKGCVDGVLPELGGEKCPECGGA